MPQSQSPGSSLSVAETGVPEPVPAAQVTAVQGGREDLTVFFTIGVIVDVFLVGAFLLWAVGQWRKSKR